MPLPYRTTDSPIIKPTDEHSVMYKFVDDLDSRKREKFLHDLSEDELIGFCASLEEFKLLTGRMPRGDFPHEKPEFQKDVRVSATTPEELQERYDEMEKSFPEKRDLEGLRNLAKKMDEAPTTAVHVTINLGGADGLRSKKS